MAQGSAGFVAFALGLACAGCSIAPAPAVTNYDFGPAPDGHPAQGPRQALLVHDVSAPAWLDSPLIHYRLAYRDSARPQVYAESRWVMSPASLFTNRLRGQLSAQAIGEQRRDRKSTRLNSSHSQISYAVFCLKKKKN